MIFLCNFYKQKKSSLGGRGESRINLQQSMHKFSESQQKLVWAFREEAEGHCVPGVSFPPQIKEDEQSIKQ